MEQLIAIAVEGFVKQGELIAELKDADGTFEEKTAALRDMVSGILYALQNIGLAPDNMTELETSVFLDIITPVLAAEVFN